MGKDITLLSAMINPKRDDEYSIVFVGSHPLPRAPNRSNLNRVPKRYMRFCGLFLGTVFYCMIPKDWNA